MDNKIKLSEFSSYDIGEKSSFGEPGFQTQKPGRRRLSAGFTYVIVKLGLCAALCGIILALALSKAPAAEDTIASLKSAENDDNQTEETLGKLKLVQLPSILEVFSPSDSPIMPVELKSTRLENGSYIAALYTVPGEEVRSSLSGTVKAISTDANLGGYIIIKHDADIEITYYGIDDISVEPGQPVTQNSTVGITKSGTLYFGVTRSGRPVDPLEFLGVGARAS